VTKLTFVDLETTGLDPSRHEAWEIGLIVREDASTTDTEYLWRIKPDLTKADPTGLRIGRFYERTAGLHPALSRKPGDKWADPAKTAEELARLLDGAHMVGAVPSFDAAFLERFLRRYGQAPTWHYHLVDVEALAAGYLAGSVANQTGPRSMASTSPRQAQ
jgi:DNA polymerase III epsilon subunit-like protein